MLSAFLLLLVGSCCDEEPLKEPVQVYGYGVPTALAISRDGRSFVTGGPLRAVLRDLESGRTRQVFDLRPSWVPNWLDRASVNWVSDLALSPDGSRLLTVDSSQALQLWDVNSGQRLTTLQHSNWISAVAFSGDGRKAAAGCGGTVLLWDAADGQVIVTLNVHTNEVTSLALSKHGKTLLTGSAGDRMARLWNVKRAELLQSFPVGENVQVVTFAPGEKEVVVASQFWDAQLQRWVGHVRWFDARRGEELRALQGSFTGVSSLALSPDGCRVVTAQGDDRGARIWDGASGQVLRTLEHPGNVSSAVFTPDGRRVLTRTGWGYPGVWLWDAATGELVRRLEGYSAEITSLAISPAGKQVVTAARGPSAVWLWDRATGQLLHSFDQPNQVNSVAFSPDGTRLLTGGSYPSGTTNGDVGIVCLWDVASGHLLQVFGEDGPVNAVTFSPDGKQFLTGCGPVDPWGGAGYARIWTLETGQVWRTFRSAWYPFVAVAYSPDGAQVLTGSGGASWWSFGQVTLWDIATDRVLWTQSPGYSGVRSVAFSPDGRRVMARGVDTYFLDRTDGQVLSTIPIERCESCYPEMGLGTAALSPSGTQVLTSSAYYFMGEIASECGQLIDADTGQVLCGLPWAGSSLTFSPDGEYVLTSMAGGVAVRWDIRDTLVRLRIQPGQAGPEVVWDAGVLQYAPSPDGPWTNLPAASPFRPSTIERQGYFRVKIE
jgi:WD40 repeat protein